MASKLKRQNRIKEILQIKHIANQEDLLVYLKRDGYEITQATLSRDFAELGVVRIFTEYGVRYILNAEESGKQIARLVGFEILTVHHNESAVIVRTLAGRAQGVAHYIDRWNKEEIIGTIGGDDTVLIIPNKQSSIPNIIALIKKIMSENPSQRIK